MSEPPAVTPAAAERAHARWAWWVLGGCFVAFTLSASLMHAYTVFLLAFVAEFGWTRAEASMAYSVGQVVGGASSPLTGSLTDRLGAQGTVLGGGRYDGLIESLGGPHTPAVGWAAGIERLAMLVGDRAPERLDVAIIPLDEDGLADANRIARDLRGHWNTVEVFATGKVKKRMSRASEGGALLAVLIGEDERLAGEVTVRDLHGGEQIRMRPADLRDAVAQAQNADWLRGLERDGITPGDESAVG